jgi:hypothetical protein
MTATRPTQPAVPRLPGQPAQPRGPTPVHKIAQSWEHATGVGMHLELVSPGPAGVYQGGGYGPSRTWG